MKVDHFVVGDAGDWERAVWAEQCGYDGVWIPEVTHDPFPMLAVAATRTATVQLGTSIALAFARNPMSLAMAANDLQLYSGGRFVLGIGSQVKPHITRRFSMPWSAPAPRMREYVLAMRTIWRCWATGEPLHFAGQYYTHTLMPPLFSPGPNPYGNPPIMLAGVGPRMTAVAGEVADGFFVHAFTTQRYLTEVTVPALYDGRTAAGHSNLDGFEISGLPFIVTGRDRAAVRTADAAVRRQIAFYASTPAYRPVLETHGWGELAEELTAMSKSGAWEAMSSRITDDMVHEFAVVAAPEQVAQRLLARYGDVFTRLGFYAPYPTPDGFWQSILREVQAETKARKRVAPQPPVI